MDIHTPPTLPPPRLFFRGGPLSLKRARVKEHRLSDNKMDLVCAGREHKRLAGRPVYFLHRAGCEDERSSRTGPAPNSYTAEGEDNWLVNDRT